jgi:tetratricopeptide (TPR) repeat protein
MHAVAMSISLLGAGGFTEVQPLLHLFSAFGPAPIPRAMLDVEQLRETPAFTDLTQQQLDATLRVMTEFHLLSVTDEVVVVPPAIRGYFIPDPDDFRFALIAFFIYNHYVTVRADAERLDIDLDWSVLPHVGVAQAIAEHPNIDQDLRIHATGTLWSIARWAERRKLTHPATSILFPVVAVRTELLGPTHAWTLVAQNLANQLVNPAGNLADTEQEILAAEADPTLTATDLYTKYAVHADSLFEAKRYPEAERYYVKAIAKAIESDSEDKLGTLFVTRQLARCQFLQKNYDGAKETHADLVARATRVVGPHHPFTLDTKGFLAEVLYTTGKDEAAAAEITDAIDQMREHLDDTSQITENALNLRLKYADRHSAQYAAHARKELYDWEVAKYGPAADPTLQTQFIMVTELEREGKHKQAVALLDDLVSKARDSVGPDHKVTQDAELLWRVWHAPKTLQVIGKILAKLQRRKK